MKISARSPPSPQFDQQKEKHLSGLVDENNKILFSTRGLINSICYSPDEDGSGSLSTITPQSRERTESDDGDQDKHLLSPTGSGVVSLVKEVPR